MDEMRTSRIRNSGAAVKTARRLAVALAFTMAVTTAAPAPAAAESDLFVVTTADFETGSTAILPAGGGDAELDPLSPIHGDAVARYHQGRIYIIERFLGDNVIVLEAGDPGSPLAQFSVGNGTNPQDIAFAGPDKAYVSRLGSAALLVVDPRDGTQLGEIDLSAYADDDGLPEMAQMAVAGNRLYVALQRLESFVPTDRSLIAVVDMETDELVDADATAAGVQAITLAATNPNEVIAIGNRLVVSNGAGFGDMAGGIEVVDLTTNKSIGVIISEEELRGDVTGLAMVTPDQGFASVQGPDFVTYTIHPVDLSTGVVGAALDGHSGGFTPNMVVDGSRLVVADFGSAEAEGGLLIYDVGSGQLLQGPVSTGLPPVNVAVMADEATAVEAEAGTPVPQTAALLAAYPNPFNAVVTIPFELHRGLGRLELAIFDSLGRRVRMLATASHSAGRHSYTWDGRNQDGATVGTGTYLVQLRVDDRTLAQKVLLVK